MIWSFATVLISYCVCENIFLLNHSIDLVVNKIQELDPYQISVFQSEETSVTNFILKQIPCTIPTIMINVNETELFNVTRETMTTHKALNSNLYVEIENSQNFNTEKIKKNLNFIAKFNSLQPRAKYLVIVIGVSKSISAHMKKLFMEAWALKFLDFTLLIVRSYEKNPIIRHYNPFFDNYDYTNISLGQLFPDKLINMNGCKIKTVLFVMPPIIEFTNESNGLQINGVNYGFWKLMPEALNFKFDYVEIHNNDITMSYYLEKIEKVSMNSHILGTHVVGLYKKGILLIGKVVRESEISLVVPIIYTTSNDNTNVYTTIIMYSSLTTLIVLLTIIIGKLHQLSTFLRSPFYIISLLFGITVYKKPKKSFERLIYISLAVSSIKYSSEIFAVFSNDNVVQTKEVAYDAFEEIKHPSFPIYAFYGYFSNEKSHDDEIIRNLKGNSIPIEHSIECYEKLASHKDRFCLNPTIHTKYIIQTYRNLGKPSPMKVAKPTITNDFFVHVFAKGSPYIKKIDKKFQQVLESGLQDSIPNSKNYFQTDEKTKNQMFKYESKKDIFYLLIFLTIGCVLGIMTYFFEFTWFKIIIAPKL